MEHDDDFFNPMPALEQAAFDKHFREEETYMAYLGVGLDRLMLRRNAVHFISKNSRTHNFDAFIPYLAMNYFDRFIASNPLPNLGIQLRDEVNLLSVCCLSLAWKMRSKSFSIQRFLMRRSELGIDQMKILDMEFLILNSLSWRMRPITAISFVRFFSNIIPSFMFRPRAINEIIIQAQGDITFTEFKPSVIAASAFLVASPNRFPSLHENIKAGLIIGGNSNLDVDRCVKRIAAMCEEKGLEITTQGQPQQHRGRAPATGIRGMPDQEVEEQEQEIQRETGIQEEHENPPQMPEDEPPLNFELKWITDENEELRLDPSLFPGRRG